MSRVATDDKGHSKFDVTKEQLEYLSKYGFTAPMMSEVLGVSESTIHRRLRLENIPNSLIYQYNVLSTTMWYCATESKWLSFYLTHPNKEKRQIITKFIVYDHELLIEKGRYITIVREDRVCSICKILDDDFHFFFNCNINSKLRETFMNHYNLKQNGFSGENDLEKLIIILNLDVVNFTAFSYYLLTFWCKSHICASQKLDSPTASTNDSDFLEGQKYLCIRLVRCIYFNQECAVIYGDRKVNEYGET